MDSPDEEIRDFPVFPLYPEVYSSKWMVRLLAARSTERSTKWQTAP